MNHSTIEWTDATWNPVYGCTPVSDGCRNCYAAGISYRFAARKGPYEGLADWKQGRAVFNGTIRLRPDKLTEPLRWRKPRRIFVNSMSDLFHEDVPDKFIAKVFGVMHATPRHTYQILTKRPERMAKWLAEWDGSCIGVEALDVIPPRFFHHDLKRVVPGFPWPLPNVWVGTSVENQKAADERIPHLLNCPAAVRFLSCEPLLESLDLWWAAKPEPKSASSVTCRDVGNILRRGIHWVICGGESGPNARPLDPLSVYRLRDDCRGLGIPFFFKQWGEWAPMYETSPLAIALDNNFSATSTVRFHDFEGADHGAKPIRVYRMGKRSTGRSLGGFEWNDMPRTTEAMAS